MVGVSGTFMVAGTGSRFSDPDTSRRPSASETERQRL